MKKLLARGFLVLCVLLLSLIFYFACNNSTPTTPTTTQPSIPDCQKYHTGVLRVQNKSARGLDYDIIIDNINYGRLVVGASRDFTLNAGSHILDFKYSDHESYACQRSYPSIIECQTLTVWCEG
jgi:hypothetical protein